MPQASQKREFAVVTGASTGIGYELARVCGRNGFDLLVVADEPKIHQAAEEFRPFSTNVEVNGRCRQSCLGNRP